ncbi:hypothetical protein ACT4UT_28010, partial [Bacillus sp. B-TM1]
MQSIDLLLPAFFLMDQFHLRWLVNDSAIPVNDMLPNLMFGHPDRSSLLTTLNEIDPLKRRLEVTDRFKHEICNQSI